MQYKIGLQVFRCYLSLCIFLNFLQLFAGSAGVWKITYWNRERFQVFVFFVWGLEQNNINVLYFREASNLQHRLRDASLKKSEICLFSWP